MEDLLSHQFGVAVGGNWILRMLLVQRDVLRDSVSCAAAGEDDLLDAGVDARTEHLVHRGDVVADVLAGVADRLTHVGVGSEVKRAFDVVFSDDAGYEVVFAGVTLFERSILDGPVVAFGEVIENDGIESVELQFLTRVAANIACSTDDQHIFEIHNKVNGKVTAELG